jgi:dTDP-4-dehydrorhamnose reductase
MTLKVLQFGATGQMALEAMARAPSFGMTLTALSRTEADLADPAAIGRIVEQADADLVINAAAYTAVDRAESERELAFLINAESPGAMARACAARGIPLVHVSTDYVFAGGGSRPWREDDPVAPINAYGDSKLAGEQAIWASSARAAILRTSWVFSAHGANFVKTMLRLSDRPQLKVVDDQRGRPTYAGDLAEAALVAGARLAQDPESPTGLFHFAGEGAVSWAEFARTIFAMRGGPAPEVAGIPSAEYPTPAARPANSVLDCERIEGAFGIVPRSWRDGLAETLAQLAEKA